MNPKMNDHQAILDAIQNAVSAPPPEPAARPAARPPQSLGFPGQESPLQSYPAAPAANHPQGYSQQGAQYAPQCAPQPAMAPAGAQPQTAIQQPQFPQSAPTAHSAIAPSAPEPVEGTVSHESDAELDGMMRERLKKRKKQHAMSIAALWLIAASGVGGGAYYYKTSETCREAVAGVIQNFKEVPQDVAQIGSTVDGYDEALKGIAAHGDQVRDATAALGVDPDSVDENDNGALASKVSSVLGDEMANTLKEDERRRATGTKVDALAGDQLRNLHGIADDSPLNTKNLKNK